MQHWLMHIFIHNSISDFMFHWPLPEWVVSVGKFGNISKTSTYLCHHLYTSVQMNYQRWKMDAFILEILAWLELLLVSEIRNII